MTKNELKYAEAIPGVGSYDLGSFSSLGRAEGSSFGHLVMLEDKVKEAAD